MSVAKVTEIISESSKSFDDAVRQGLERANKTLKGVQSAWIKDHKISLKNGTIETFRVTMKVTFVLQD